MDYLVICLVGFGCGAGLVYFLMEKKRREISSIQRRIESQKSDNVTLRLELEKKASELRQYQNAIDSHRTQLEGQVRAFEQRSVSYSDLEKENGILRLDLNNLDVEVRKLKLDGLSRDARQLEITERVDEVGRRYMKDSVNWISKLLNTNNFIQCKQRLLDTVQRCRGIGLEVAPEEEESLISDLRSNFEKAVREAFEREEQARIKSQIREEEARKREIDRELKQLERERAAITAALEKAVADAAGVTNEEIERLRERLADAEARAQRAISQAQLTKSGHVYVISNIGSFGEQVFKIGMTRRLQPQERVSELSGASVPFPFDVHMMISCDNAPALENALHRALHRNRLNRMNPRKEFFRTSVDEILAVVRDCHGEVDYLADPEALQYHQSVEMTDDDQEFIENIYDELEDGTEVTDD